MRDEVERWNNGMGQPSVADWSEETQPERNGDFPAPAIDDGTAAYVAHKKLTDRGYKHVANAMKENADNTHTFTNWYKWPNGMIAVAHDEHPDNFCGSENTRAWTCAL